MFQPMGTVLCCFPAVKYAACFRSDLAKGLKLPLAPFSAKLFVSNRQKDMFVAGNEASLRFHVAALILLFSLLSVSHDVITSSPDLVKLFFWSRGDNII